MSLTQTTTVAILSGQSLSAPASFGAQTLLRVAVSAGFTGTAITFQTSSDGVTYGDLYDELGAVYTLVVAASRVVFISPGPLVGVGFIKFRSGTPAAPTAQAADTILSCVLQQI